MTEATLMNIPLNMLDTDPEALRDVDVENEEFISLRDDIEKRGILLPVLVSEYTDEAGEQRYMLRDGLQRFSCAKMLGFATIPAHVKDMTKDEALVAQFAANYQRVKTKPFQFAQHLMRFMKNNQHLNKAQLAATFNVNPAFIDQRLKLTNLEENVGALVDDGKVTIVNAVALTKLPQDDQVEFVDRAQTMKPEEFLPLVDARVTENRAAARENRAPASEEFVPVPRLRKPSEIKEELSSCEVTDSLSEAAEDKRAAGRAVLFWILQLDEESVEEQRAKWEADKKAREEAKAARAAAREEKKRLEAAEKQAEIATA